MIFIYYESKYKNHAWHSLEFKVSIKVSQLEIDNRVIFSLAKDIKNLKIYLIISDQIQFKIFMHAKVAVSDQYSIAKFLQLMQSELR